MYPKLARATGLVAIVLMIALATSISAQPPRSAEEPKKMLHDPREVRFADVKQMTFKGENAEAYWAPDGEQLILQARFGSYECDQIFTLDPKKPGELNLVSTGKGRTTCAYFSYPTGDRIIYSSTHLADEACPPTPDFSRGYVWPIYPSFEIFTANPDGSDLVQVTKNDVYDAEATVCQKDGSVIFTSTRDGDLDLYRMDFDGSNVKRLTSTPGYDGGAFFSTDCKQIVWRASRPEGDALKEYQALLKENLVRPSELEIFVADADGSNARQISNVGGANFAPYLFPNGKRVIFSSNHHSEGGREFDLFAINLDGTDLEQITFTEGFDGFPMFTPDGKGIAFASNRNQAQRGWTDVYVARWVENPE